MLMNPGPFPFMHHDEIGATVLGGSVGGPFERGTRRLAEVVRYIV